MALFPIKKSAMQSYHCMDKRACYCVYGLHLSCAKPFFNGFGSIVKSLYGDFYSDVRITPAKGKFAVFSPRLVNKYMHNGRKQ